MPQSISVIARQPLEYQGRSLVRGDQFDVTPIEAAALTRARKVDFAPKLAKHELSTREMVPDAPSGRARKTAGTPRRRYRRRDVTAGEDL